MRGWGRVAPFLFGSGACALVYQVAWQRELRFVFGASTAASAAVLAVFVGGLGVGSYFLGEKAERHARPLALYGRLEIGVALLAAASPFLLDGIRAAYIALGGSSTLGPVGATVARLVLAALVIAAPTTLMGGTFPAAAREAMRAGGAPGGSGDVVRGDTARDDVARGTDDTPDVDPERRAVAALYGVNTLGAVLGAAATTFLLLETCGTRLTLAVAATTNLLIGVVAHAIGRRTPEIALPAPDAPPPEARRPTSAPPPRAFTLAAAATTGFAFFLLELVWYRMLGPLLGGTVFTFGLVLAIALFGIGVGGGVYAWTARRGRATLSAFATTSLVEAACVAAPFALGDRLAVLALQLRPLGAVGFAGHVLAWSLVAAIVVLPAAIVAGAQFPMLVALLGRGRPGVAREVGLTYAANTAGAVVGALAGGFGLIPWLSAPGAWRAVAGALVVLGVVAAAIAALRAPRHASLQIARNSVAPLILAAATIALLGARGPTAAWRHGSIGVGRAPLGKDANGLEAWVREQRRALLREIEGVESSVALMRTDDVSFVMNGKSDGAVTYDAATQVMGGVLGALRHPAPRRAMVIGLGTGSSAGWLATLPSIEAVDVVELEPAILDVARFCAPVNGDVLAQPKVHVRLGDAREVLQTSRARYDVVFSEPSNPYRAGVASLFTAEFYRSAAARLDDGGVFLQWLQAYEIDARTLQTVYRTIGSVFPSVETWELKKGDLLLVASKADVPFDLPRLRARVAEPAYAAALAAGWRTADVDGVLAHFVARPAFARRLADAAGTALNTDDLSPVEFGFARSVGATPIDVVAELRAMARAAGLGTPPAPAGAIDETKVAMWRRAAELAEDGSAPSPPFADATEERRARAQGLYAAGRFRDAWSAWQAQPAGPVAWPDVDLVASGLADAGDDRAIAWAERLRALPAGDPDAVIARLAVRTGRLGDARDALLRAIARYRRDPWTMVTPTRQAIALAREIAARDPDPATATALWNALAEPFAVRRLDETRLAVRLDLARRLGPASPRACVDALAPYEPDAPFDAAFLAYRLGCYANAADPRAIAARADLAAFVARDVAHLDTGDTK